MEDIKQLKKVKEYFTFINWRQPPVKESEAIKRSPHPPVPGGLIDEGKNHPDVEALLLLATENAFRRAILVADLARPPEPLKREFIVVPHPRLCSPICHFSFMCKVFLLLLLQTEMQGLEKMLSSWIWSVLSFSNAFNVARVPHPAQSTLMSLALSIVSQYWTEYRFYSLSHGVSNVKG